MDYKDIFSPSTMAKMNSQSAANLQAMLGDKNLMQTLMSSQQLLMEVIEIEKPYIPQLEELSVQMVEDMYPIINDDNIQIDAKIVSMEEVNQSLDEIKINTPSKYNPYLEDKYNPFEKGKNVRITIQNFLKNNPNATEKQIVNIISNKEYLYSKNTISDNLRRTSDIVRNISKNINTGRKVYTYSYSLGGTLNENSPEQKRRVINGITQGAALKGAFSFYLFKEYLDIIDDTLVEKYNQLMKEVFGIYDDENAIAMFLRTIASGQHMGGGSSKVIVNEIKINSPINIWNFNKYIPNFNPRHIKVGHTIIFNTDKIKNFLQKYMKYSLKGTI